MKQCWIVLCYTTRDTVGQWVVQCKREVVRDAGGGGGVVCRSTAETAIVLSPPKPSVFIEKLGTAATHSRTALGCSRKASRDSRMALVDSSTVPKTALRNPRTAPKDSGIAQSNSGAAPPKS